MTKFRRVLNVLTGICMIAIGILLFIDEPQDAMRFMLFCIQLGMTLRGLRALYYYLTMAKYMVGGKQVIYGAMIYLDIGILAGTLYEHPVVYAVIYMAALHAFGGLISMLRASESRKIRAQWRLRMASGITELLMAIVISVIAIVFGKPDAAVYVYGAGLVYSAVLRIAQAFRRTDIVYIQ